MTRALTFSAFAGTLLISSCPLHAQLLRPNFITPDFYTSQPEYGHWEYSRWDKFYTPHDAGDTLPQNRNYPDVAAPRGYAVAFVGSDDIGPLGDVAESPAGSGKYAYVGPFNGEYVWTAQSFSEAAASGYQGSLPTNPNPAQPRTIFHADNPSIRQHSSGAFIIGPGFTGNIYSFSSRVSYTIDDSLAYDAGSVVLQFQNQGRDVDMESLRLRYRKDGGMVELPATDAIIEREAFASHAGFTFTTRTAVEWNVSALGIRDYEIVWKAAGTSSSTQEVLLDTTDAYVRDKGVPAKRIFTGASGADWDQPANWNDVAGNASLPLDCANLVLHGGGVLNAGSGIRKASLLEIGGAGDFTVRGDGSLELGTGLTATASQPKRIDFDVPVKMTAFNFFDVGADVTVALNRPFSGQTGFEKRGAGNLTLAADNTFTGALFVSGGSLTVSGANSYGSPGGADLTYLNLGEIVLEKSGTLGAPGLSVEIGATPYETPGEQRPSRLVIKGGREIANPVNFTGGYNPKALVFSGTETGAICAAPVTLDDGTTSGTFGDESPTGDVDLETPLATDKVTFTGTITGGATVTGAPNPSAVRKTGAGTVIFAGTDKAYKHQTRVNQGTFLLESGTAITGGNSVTVDAGATFTANGAVSLANSTLLVDGLFDGTGDLVRTGKVTIAGAGTIAKPLAIATGTTISPGNGIGTLAFAGGQTWGEDGALSCEISGTAGHDSVAIAGALTFASTPAKPFVVKPLSLDLAGAAGPVAGFNGYGSHTWTIATASGGIIGFNPAAATVDVSEFTNLLHGIFSVETQGNDLVLRYTPNAVPVDSFAGWAATLPAGLQGPHDDADHDGISNLVEFASGTSAITGGDAASILAIRRPVTGGTILEFTFAEPFRPGVTLWLQGAAKLGSWQALGVKAGVAAWQSVGVITEGATTPGRKSYSVWLPDDAGRYFRLQFRNEE